MSIQFNMTNAQELGQERFMWGISNSDDSGGGCRKIEKQSPPSQPSHLQSEIQTETVKKVAKGKKRTKRSDEKDVEESPDHEIHIWTERERRKKMRDMFAKLHALLPQLPPKVFDLLLRTYLILLNDFLFHRYEICILIKNFFLSLIHMRNIKIVFITQFCI